jgi:hypothetical protein
MCKTFDGEKVRDLDHLLSLYRSHEMPLKRVKRKAGYTITVPVWIEVEESRASQFWHQPSRHWRYQRGRTTEEKRCYFEKESEEKQTVYSSVHFVGAACVARLVDLVTENVQRSKKLRASLPI